MEDRNRKVEKYGIFEIEMRNVSSQKLLDGHAVFVRGDRTIKVRPFFKNEGVYAARFLPDEEGVWTYRMKIAGKAEEGEFVCVPNTGNNHGRVQTCGTHFQYEDNTTYIPVGTTCYAWIHQTETLQEQTLQTLQKAPFNKIRMCVFPKSMPYNHNDPDCYPFEKNAEGMWDVNHIDCNFWDKLDQRMDELMSLGIEADLILFHPYDRWGFSKLSREDCLTYLRYCLARLGAYRNLWWSLANEYETLFKNTDEWDELGESTEREDPFHHLISIHNMIAPYPKRDWMTHCSIQSMELNKVITWRKHYRIPVIVDECGYEGNLSMAWGSLTGFEMIHRFWQTICRGGFCTHGETFDREDEVLWWAKGGVLHGESAERIAFLKQILECLPGPWEAINHAELDPNQETGEEVEDENNPFLQMLYRFPEADREAFEINTCPMKIKGNRYFMEYFGGIRPCYKDFVLRADKTFKIEIIDIWNMTKELYTENATGHIKVKLPGKEGIAVLVTEQKG